MQLSSSSGSEFFHLIIAPYRVLYYSTKYYFSYRGSTLHCPWISGWISWFLSEEDDDPWNPGAGQSYLHNCLRHPSYMFNLKAAMVPWTHLIFLMDLHCMVSFPYESFLSLTHAPCGDAVDTTLPTLMPLTPAPKRDVGG